jgi:hypothetical protein
MSDIIAIYQRIVTEGNRPILTTLLKESGYWKHFHALEMSFCSGETPYFLLTLGDSKAFADGDLAYATLGIVLDREDLEPLGLPGSAPFYLPLVTRPVDLPKGMPGLPSEELSLAHELIHVRDLLRWCQEDPNYPERTLRDCFTAVTRANLADSIDFETLRIFRLEPPAMRHDYDAGEHIILTPMIFAIVFYECESRSEYLELNISSYLRRLRQQYHQKFPADRDFIELEFTRRIELYGQEVFGATPVLRVAELEADTLDRIIRFDTRKKAEQQG